MTRAHDGLVPLDGDHAVSAVAAFAFIQRSRKQGGAARLFATGLLMPITMGLWMGAFVAPYSLAAALPATALLVRNLRQGLRSGAVAAEIERAARLPPPLSALVIDRRLLLGNSNTPRSTWCSIPLTYKEEQTIRALGLPAARLRRGGDTSRAP